MAEISRSDSKVWFNIKTKEPIFVDPFKSNHTQDPLRDPEKYGLKADFFDNIEKPKYDYDGDILYIVMKCGFVRIAVDFRDPRYGCNAEGLSMRDVQKATEWLNDFVEGIKKIVIVIRHSQEDKDGTAYILDDMEKIEFFIKYGKVLRDRF